MDLGRYHTTCRIACKEAYDSYKHSINVNLFAVDDDYISQNISHMLEDINVTINKVYFIDPVNPKQHEVAKSIKQNYTDVATTYALRYGKKYLKHGN